MTRTFFIVSATALGAGMALTSLAAAAPTAQKAPPQFAQCAICHKTAAGDKATIGPNLFGIVGKKAGSSADFAYSTAMKKAGIVWTKPNLTSFISSPQTLVKGNRMPFPGQKDPKATEAIVQYLATLK